MKKNINISYHLDKSVVYLFLAVFLTSASLLAFRYTKHSPCKDVAFTIDANNYSVDELIRFKDQTEQANTWQWNFGDETTKSVKNPIHIYKNPGEYTIELLVNGICVREETITINEKEKVIDERKFPIFNLPKSIMVGETLTVEDESPNATTWEWRFGETASANSKTKNAKYTYKNEGLHTVSLIVNGDLKHITKKIIEVVPISVKQENAEKLLPVIKFKPTTPDWNIKKKPTIVVKDKPAIKIVPYISDIDFTNKLLLVSKQEMSAKQFSEYFCGDINKAIIVNGKNTTFLVFCEKISNKKIKLKEVVLFRDKGSNCIINITIDYKKSGWF